MATSSSQYHAPRPLELLSFELKEVNPCTSELAAIITPVPEKSRARGLVRR
jgi:hypothetical protein